MVQSTGYAVYYAPVLQWAFLIHKVQTKGVTLQFEVQDNGTSMVYHPAISPLAMNVPSGSENECNVIENLEMFIVEKKKKMSRFTRSQSQYSHKSSSVKDVTNNQQMTQDKDTRVEKPRASDVNTCKIMFDRLVVKPVKPGNMTSLFQTSQTHLVALVYLLE